MSMTIIGVTGGIGAGKSSVSQILKELGAHVIDADELSRRAVEYGMPAYFKIIDEFGTQILEGDKSINRKKLAEIVFNSPERRKRLEEIVHAEVVDAMLKEIKRLVNENYQGLVVLDVPIPVEHGFLDTAHTVWVVTAPEETRIKRVCQRSGLSYEEAKSRINSQMPQHEYIRLADEVIENQGTLEELYQKVAELVEKLQKD